MWIIASVPFWFLGALLMSVACYGIVRVSLNETDIQTFSTAPDNQVLRTAFGMILLSGLLLFVAAKIAS